MQERTIPQMVFLSAERFGQASAIEDGDTRLSFREVAEMSLRAARAFMAAGIQPGDRVAIWAPNIWEWVIATFGLQMAGGVLVPLSTRLKGAEAGYILRKSRASVLCTVSDFLGANYLELLANEDLPDLRLRVVLRGGGVGAQTWKKFLASADSVSEEAARERAAAVKPDDLSDILFTSGTTGNPKGVMTEHGQNLRVFEVWTEMVGLTEGDRYLIVNVFSHSFGYKAGFLSAVMRGATILPQAVFDADQVLARIEPDRINVLPGPPTLYQSLLAHPDKGKYDLSCLRLAVTGAAAVPVELVHRMRDELGFKVIVTAYGMTETSGMISICRPGDDVETIATTSGCAIPGVEVRCVDEKGVDVPTGEPGEVIVRGYNVMRGYLDDPVETAKTIAPDGWLHTGDIAVMNEHGYLTITDRIKDMFIVGGFNCYPAEIENLMFGSGWFAQVAVIGIPDERMGEVGMAFVVPAPGKSFTQEDVIAWCRENMANYKAPRRVALVDALPTNASNKVTKFVLREEAAKLLA